MSGWGAPPWDAQMQMPWREWWLMRSAIIDRQQERSAGVSAQSVAARIARLRGFGR